MNIIYNKYLDIEDFLPENRTLVLDYLCPLCKGIYYKPVVDPCGSIYCRKCIEQCLEKTKTCPSGKAFGTQALITIDFITNVLDKLELFCKNKVSGCNWRGRLATLDEHIEKQCDYQCVRCTNEGCKTVLRKSNLDNHLGHCEFKKEKCEHCEVYLTRLTLPAHLEDCPKMRIECTQFCGVLVERSLICSHITNDCGMSLIDCSYEQLGCNFKATRVEVEQHLMDNNVKHSLLFFNEITAINSKIKDLNHKFDEVTKVLATTKTSTTEVKKIFQIQEKVPLEKKKYIEEVQNGFQQKFVPKLTRKKRERSATSSESSEKVQEIDLDDIQDSSMSEDSKPDVVIDSPQKNEKNSKSMISSSTTAQIKEKELYSEEITIDTIEISKGIEVKLNTATCISMNKNEHKFAMANNILNGSNCRWKVKVLKVSGWMGVGICLKELVVSNKLKFVGSKSNFTHGTFMVSLNGYSWNTNDREEDNTQIENFQKIKSGDEVECEFNEEKEQLKISVNDKFSVIINNVQYPRGNCLTPCVIFLSPGDQVSFSQMTKY